MELTQEYLDRGLENLTKHIDKRIDDQTGELRNYTHQAFEAQQQWMEERFSELLETHELQKRLGQLEERTREASSKLGIPYPA